MGGGPTVSACGAVRCRAAIRYVRLVGGGEIPIDYTLDPAGPLIPVVVDGEKRVRPRAAGDDDGRPGFVPHWDSCPTPAHWEAVRRAADRAGITAPPRGRASGSDYGLCAGCYRPGHIAYGPRCRGLLCDACVAVREAWLALPEDDRRRTRLVYPRWDPAAGARNGAGAGAVIPDAAPPGRGPDTRSPGEGPR
jgi:hypothetical protein